MTTNDTLRNLGRTDLKVSKIGLGVMQFSGAGSFFRWVFNDLPQSEMNAIVAEALKGGINWFDTSRFACIETDWYFQETSPKSPIFSGRARTIIHFSILTLWVRRRPLGWAALDPFDLSRLRKTAPQPECA